MERHMDHKDLNTLSLSSKQAKVPLAAYSLHGTSVNNAQQPLRHVRPVVLAPELEPIPSAYCYMSPRSCVRAVMEDKARQADVEEANGDYDSRALMIGDMGAVVRQHQRWSQLLPNVEPFYAVKCNTDPQVLRTLALLCAGFDCASLQEMDVMLGLGVDPKDIIFANPCKLASHIRYARKHNIELMTFDNTDELHKIKSIFPGAKLVIRVLTDDSKSCCKLGQKFGADPSVTKGLLETAKALGLQVVGVSFHVGSGCTDPLAYEEALQRSRVIFEEGQALGYHFTLLDVGGGYPGITQLSGLFEEIAQVLQRGIAKHFPNPGLRIIAEPGRFYVAAAFSLATTITSRRVIMPHAYTDPLPPPFTPGRASSDTDTDMTPRFDSHASMVSPSFMYYLNDGAYGTLNCVINDNAQVLNVHVMVGLNNYSPKLDCNGVTKGPERRGCGEDEAALYDSSLWGPTIANNDCITTTIRLPELGIGDWLAFEEIGAYNLECTTGFGGFPRSRAYYINTQLPRRARAHTYTHTLT